MLDLIGSLRLELASKCRSWRPPTVRESLYLHWLGFLPSWLIASIALLLVFSVASGLLFLRTVRQLDAGSTVVVSA
jgi:hypothetical protein